jgi:hypothetical protein
MMSLLILLNNVIFLYIDSIMDITRVTIEQGKKTISVEISQKDIDYMAFMDLIRIAVKASKYQKEEINDYVLDWADHIKATHEN